jgi:hypothetical protein
MGKSKPFITDQSTQGRLAHVDRKLARLAVSEILSLFTISIRFRKKVTLLSKKPCFSTRDV